MAPGAIPRPGRVRNRDFCPPKLVCDGGGAAELFWKNSIPLGFSRRRQYIGGRASRRWPRGPHPSQARPRGPRLGGVASPWPSSVSGLDSVFVRENRDFGFCFVQFREYFLCSFSETKNSRKQELALWHLVNRLVPENA